MENIFLAIYGLDILILNLFYKLFCCCYSALLFYVIYTPYNNVIHDDDDDILLLSFISFQHILYMYLFNTILVQLIIYEYLHYISTKL